MSLPRYILAAGIVAAGAMAATAQNFILNPSFELPVVGAGSYQVFATGQTIGAGWVVDSSAIAVDVLDKGYASGGVTWAPPTHGNQYLYLGDSASAATIRQDVSLAAGGPYRLTFDLANFLSFHGTSAKTTVNVVNLGDSSSVVGGGQDFTRPSGAGYASQELDFTVPQAGNYRVLVSNPDGFGSNVDNFALVAVPEPSAYAILAGAGVLGFAALRRFRRA